MTNGFSGSRGPAVGATFLGIFEGHSDPAVAVVRDGRVLAYSEEERHIRFKHAHGIYPSRALSYCLAAAGVGIQDVTAVGVNWNVPAYSDGTMAAFYEGVKQNFPVDAKTIAWQEMMLRRFRRESLESIHHAQWRRLFVWCGATKGNSSCRSAKSAFPIHLAGSMRLSPSTSASEPTTESTR